jgi:uncharacterized protein involved in response to NO
MVTAGALLRVLAPLVPEVYLALVTCGGDLWSFAFVLFALRYGPMLLSGTRRSAAVSTK